MTGGDLGFGPCHGQLLSTLFVGVVLGRKIGYAVVAFVLGGALMSPIDAWRTYLIVLVVWCGVLDHLGGIFFLLGSVLCCRCSVCLAQQLKSSVGGRWAVMREIECVFPVSGF